MISVTEAIEKVKNYNCQLETLKVNVTKGLGYYLSENIYATFNLPSFNQSAMDGYALGGKHSKYILKGEIKAGDTNIITINDGEAYRIFTGAMTPLNCYAVMQQELVEVNENQIIIKSEFEINKNIRQIGGEINKGDLLLNKYTKINPAAVGLLVSFGIENVNVFKKPKIAIVVTGNELTPIGEPLFPGKIYESNSHMLQSALLGLNYECDIHKVEDNYKKTENLLDNCIKDNDLVIVSGGISVGDYDFVGKALNNLNVNNIFYKVKQKPGKPLYYGNKENTQIFALPGNPAAALSCFYMYVLIALNKLSGSNTNKGLNSIEIKISHDIEIKGDRAQFLKANFENNAVTILNKQSSAMLSSFAEANCLVYIPETSRQIKKGSLVTIYLLN
jgi:molybdopterin molybdotransferase